MTMTLLYAAAAVASANVSIAGPTGPLVGTLTAPLRSAPAMILIPGSGPTNRDGDNPAGVAGGIYRQLSDQLAARGVATLRVDKRGLFGSRAAIRDPNAVTIADYAADVRGWARFLHARGKRCVWLGGHSEGGLIALAAAAEDPRGICGLVLLAAPGRPLGAVLRAQLRPQLPAADFAQADIAIRRLEARQKVDPASVPAPLRSLFAPAVQPYLTELVATDPARLAAATRLPMLIVQGSTDLQVSVADAQALAAARPDARLTIIPGINHVWRRAPSDPVANAATYRDASRPVDPAVAIAIASFVRTRSGRALAP